MFRRFPNWLQFEEQEWRGQSVSHEAIWRWAKSGCPVSKAPVKFGNLGSNLAVSLEIVNSAISAAGLKVDTERKTVLVEDWSFNGQVIVQSLAADFRVIARLFSLQWRRDPFRPQFIEIRGDPA